MSFKGSKRKKKKKKVYVHSKNKRFYLWYKDQVILIKGVLDNKEYTKVINVKIEK